MKADMKKKETLQDVVLETISDKVPMTDSISTEELQQIKDLKSKSEIAKLEAEKAIAISEKSVLEFEKLILQIFNKYKLDMVLDSLNLDGKIVRGKQ